MDGVLVALLWACRAAPAAPRLAMSLSTDWPDSWPWRDPSRDSRCADAPCTGINERMPVETLPMAEVAPWRGEWQHVPFITGHGGLYLHWTSSSHDGGVQLELSHHGEVFVLAHRTHFSHMSHPTFPTSHILILFLRGVARAGRLCRRTHGRGGQVGVVAGVEASVAHPTPIRRHRRTLAAGVDARLSRGEAVRARGV